MAGAMEVFRRNALANQRLEEEALAQRAAADENRRAAEMQAQERAAQMQQATAELGRGLHELAIGNLDYTIETVLAPEFEQLRHNFNRSITQVSETLSAVVASAHVIDGGAREVSESASDLSNRTEQQAASLEETAAALDEITANVKSFHSTGAGGSECRRRGSDQCGRLEPRAGPHDGSHEPDRGLLAADYQHHWCH